MKPNLKTIIAELREMLEPLKEGYSKPYVPLTVEGVIKLILKKLEDFEAFIQREVRLMDGDVKRGETNEWVPFFIREVILGLTEEEILKE